MIRGKTIFRCTECHKVFVGMDIEWQATTLSMPVQCPNYGSKHTLPLLAAKSDYEDIWKTIDNNK